MSTASKYKIPAFSPADPPQEYIDLARRLRKAREEAKLHQSDVTALIGMPAPILSAIENARRRLTVFELAALCTIYGQRMEPIVLGEAIQAPDIGEIAIDQSVRAIAVQLSKVPGDRKERLIKQIRALLELELS